MMSTQKTKGTCPGCGETVTTTTAMESSNGNILLVHTVHDWHPVDEDQLCRYDPGQFGDRDSEPYPGDTEG